MEEICEKIVRNLEKQNRTISFMESCTGGFLANSITNISGASNVLKVSLVTYSTVYKEKFGVDKNIIKNYRPRNGPRIYWDFAGFGASILSRFRGCSSVRANIEAVICVSL